MSKLLIVPNSLVLSAAEQRAWLAMQDIPRLSLLRTPGAALATALGLSRASADELLDRLVKAGAADLEPPRGCLPREAAACCVVHRHAHYESCGDVREFRTDKGGTEPYACRARQCAKVLSKNEFPPLCLRFLKNTEANEEAEEPGAVRRTRHPRAPIEQVFARVPATRTKPTGQEHQDALTLLEYYTARRRSFQPGYRGNAEALQYMVDLRRRLLESDIGPAAWRAYMTFAFEDCPGQTGGRLKYPPPKYTTSSNTVERFLATLGTRKLDMARAQRMLRGAGFVDVHAGVVCSMARHALSRYTEGGPLPEIRPEDGLPFAPAAAAAYTAAVHWLLPRLREVGYKDEFGSTF